MNLASNLFAPGPAPQLLIAPNGQIVRIPDDWTLLPPGDAALTRRVKAAGAHWVVQEKKGRKTFSRGICAPLARVNQIRTDLAVERASEVHAKRTLQAKQRREKKQSAYVEDFYGAVLQFLNFHLRYATEGQRLAKAVTEHATPVGSGTVARTERIPIEDRVQAAVIAWMRHQTTAYDTMVIPRVKGKRREVRRMLASESERLLGYYRRGDSISDACPLRRALVQIQ